MAPIAMFANNVLEREAWARERLAAHAGRVFVVTIGPVTAALSVGSTGLIETTPLSGAPPDLELRISPLVILSFLADPARWDTLVTADGDAELASTLRELSLTLPWFVERALASALGPIVGQRVADAGRRLLTIPEYAAARFGESVGSYARDEAGLLARGDEARPFADQTAQLAARLDVLAARVEALCARLPSGAR
jgi:ubiquinone biosynthesis protein UbiJ